MEKDKICALIIVSNPVILYTRFQMLNIEWKVDKKVHENKG